MIKIFEGCDLETGMGGISGIRSRGRDETASIKPLLQRMLGQICHRGDTSTIQLWNADVSIGANHNKQTQAEGQTIAFNQEKDLGLVMDGEAFLRDPHNWLPNAEALLSLYEKEREDFVNRIDGSFAIAIWDGKEKKLLLVRDRLGARPLFYLQTSGALIFGSEVKSAVAADACDRSIDLKALNNFLSFGYVPNPDTLFKSIRQVKPGHVLINTDDNTIEKPYWDFTYKKNGDHKPETFYLKKFFETLETAVSKRLESHPDAGAFLSGGLDTSGVVAIMHKLNGAPFKVFTAGFEEEKYNEIGDAKILADRLGLEHHTITIKFDNTFPELLEKLVWHHDAPFADTSAIPSYYVAKLAKEYVDVVFTGDFPDQLIGGSGHQVHALYREQHDPAWKGVLRNKVLRNLIKNLDWSAGGVSFLDKVKRALYRETFSLEEQRILLGMPVPPLLKKCLYSPDLLEIDRKNDPLEIARALYREAGDVSLLDRILYFDIHSYAPDDLMVKVDRMSAAHGLTAISPFHDRELVEFIATIPTNMKIRGNERKYIMREALRPLLPEQVLNKKKQGFAMPMGEWLMRKLSDYVRDVLLDSRTLNRGYFNKKFMRKMVENFLAGKTDYASGSEATIISLITLELWHRIFIDK